MSGSALVSYIEKQKSLLRKLKVSFGRKRRQEEAKVLNRQFKEDPGRVYATITIMAEEDPDNARPKYKVARNEDQTSASKGVFSDIVEAEGFWRRLWEERGTGDENAEWLKEIELEIHGNKTATKRMKTGKKYLVERIIERRETHLVNHIFEYFVAFVSKYKYDRGLNDCKELLAVN